MRLKGISHSATFTRYADTWARGTKMETLINDEAQGNATHRLTFGDILNRYLSEIVPKKRGEKQETIRIKRFLRDDITPIVLNDLSPIHFAMWRNTH